MANDGQIVFEVTADGKHAIADIKEITRQIQQESGKWDKSVKESTNNMDLSFSGLIKKLSVAAIGAGIVNGLKNIASQAINTASDLQEVQNVVDTTFGDNARQIETWAKSAGSQFGLTELQAKKFSSTMGAMLKSAGMADNDIVQMSTDLSGLAADMASFYNLDFDTAFQKIRSGISGETEPLKQLGINMSTANLEAFALSKGLEKTWNQMTQGEQTMLRYQYIMQATSDAQGDFAKTSDGFANSQRRIQTAIDTIQTNLGNFLLSGVEPVVAGVADLLTKLTTAPERTIFDDFNDIDVAAEEKIAKIQATANEARLLTEELDKINGEKSSNASSAVQKLVDDLTGITLNDGKVNTVKSFIESLAGNIDTLAAIQGTSNEEAKAWLSGIADAADKLDESDVAGWQSLVDLIKDGLPGFENTDVGKSFFQSLTEGYNSVDTNAVKEFINTLASDVTKITSLSGQDAEGAAEWLQGIADAADTLDPEDAEGWATLIDSIKEGLPGLENTEYGKAFFASLGEGFGQMADETSTLDWIIDTLGNKTERTADEQAYWLEVCNRLVKTIPGLSAIINTETGEIKGGTQAVKDYIAAWESGETKLALLGALQQKESALSSRFSNLPEYQLDMALEKRRAKQRLEELKALYDQYGLKVGFDANGKVNRDFSNVYGLTEEGRKALNDAADALDKQTEKAKEATQKYKEQAEALEEAKIALQEYADAIEAEYGSIEASTEEWSDTAKEAAKTVIDTLKTTLQEMSDYVEGVRTSTMQAIESTVKGFEKVETPMMQARQKVKDLTAEMGSLDTNAEDYADQWKKINDEINKTNAEKISAQGMGRNLEQQAQFMADYLDFLNQARENGISADVLAQLSDGSVESYDYLEALANAAPSEVQKINENFQKVIDKKNQLAQELTGQKLAVDDVYKSMQERAKEAVAALDLGEEAKTNAGKTVSEMAQGIKDHVSEVGEAVDSILEQLNRLDGWGINIDLGGFGEINFTTSTGDTADAFGRFGIGYVPRDDYLIRAHEGERLLTAQENQIWNSLLNGGVAGFDLEDLGGVMRDNIRPGGNVYLNGEQVGRVVSEMQGRSYKSLQRSGWQG